MVRPAWCGDGDWTISPEPDDHAMILGSAECGVLVLDDQRRSVVALNRVLAGWVGVPDTEAARGASPLAWIVPEFRGEFLALGAANPRSEPLHLKLEGTGERHFDVRGSYRVNARGEGRWVYWFTPTVESSAHERELLGELDSQKRRAAEAVRTSLQIFQVTEKIRRAPRLSALLIGVREEQELYRRVGKFFLGEAIHARFVRLLIADEAGVLQAVYSSCGTAPEDSHGPARVPLCDALALQERDELDPHSWWEPIEHAGKPIGLLEIQLERREQKLLDEAPIFRT